MLPAKADPDAQARYLGEELEPRLAQARAGQRAVFFVDAAHFVLAPFLGFLWSVTRHLPARPCRAATLQRPGRAQRALPMNS